MKYKCTSDRCAINKKLASGNCGAFEPHLWSCAVPREATSYGMAEAVKFDCNGNNAPAYSCNKPGDNSGEYVKAEDYATLQHELAICMDALREIFNFTSDGEVGVMATRALKKVSK